jgi:hypothetical protein
MPAGSKIICCEFIHYKICPLSLKGIHMSLSCFKRKRSETRLMMKKHTRICKCNHPDLPEFNLFSWDHYSTLKFQCLIFDHQLHPINNFVLTSMETLDSNLYWRSMKEFRNNSYWRSLIASRRTRAIFFLLRLNERGTQGRELSAPTPLRPT